MTEATNRRAKILVVDDSPLVLKATTLILEQQGYEVVARDSPFGTARVVLIERPDLVLMDYNMPALSGDDLTRLIRENVKTENIRVVIFSDRPRDELEDCVSRCGANGYIQKTANPDELCEAVASWLEAA